MTFFLDLFVNNSQKLSTNWTIWSFLGATHGKVRPIQISRLVFGICFDQSVNFPCKVSICRPSKRESSNTDDMVQHVFESMMRITSLSAWCAIGQTFVHSLSVRLLLALSSHSHGPLRFDILHWLCHWCWIHAVLCLRGVCQFLVPKKLWQIHQLSKILNQAVNSQGTKLKLRNNEMVLENQGDDNDAKLNSADETSEKIGTVLNMHDEDNMDAVGEAKMVYDNDKMMGFLMTMMMWQMRHHDGLMSVAKVDISTYTL